MRSRILLFIILATTIAMLPACSGRSTNPPKAGSESATPVPSSPSAGSNSAKSGGGSAITVPSSTSVGSTPTQAPGDAPPSAPPRCSPSPSAKAGATAAPSGTELPAAPPPSADTVRFGRVTASDPTADITIDPDRTTLTARFSAFEVSAGSESATRTSSLVVPLTDGAQNAKVTFYASGFAFADEGATARLTLRVNGHKLVKDFPAGSQVEYVQRLQLPAIPASQYRLSAVVEAHQAPGCHDATAFLSVSAIDAAIT
jgi:hypothetical protein